MTVPALLASRGHRDAPSALIRTRSPMEKLGFMSGLRWKLIRIECSQLYARAIFIARPFERCIRLYGQVPALNVVPERSD